MGDHFRLADLSGLIERGPSLSSSFWDRRQQGACFSDDAVLEVRVAHLRGAEHRLAFLIVVDAGLARFIEQ